LEIFFRAWGRMAEAQGENICKFFALKLEEIVELTLWSTCLPKRTNESLRNLLGVARFEKAMVLPG
jgi:hypothetical protein